MTAITVTIPGNPVPYARADSSIQFGGGKGRRHDPRVADYLEKCRLFATQATQQARLAGIAWPRTGVRYAVLVLVVRETGQVCDVDNVAKSALDGCGADRRSKLGGLWINDTDVDDLRVVRCAPERENARLVVMAQTIGSAKSIDDLEWMRPQTLTPFLKSTR